jgi:threonine dehydrogenase-like Zn-dependent dehydrogenase
MRALFYPAFDSLEIRDLPIPKPAPGEVLVRVAACGLCGSELETFKNRSPRRTPPLVMGHEFCGVVEEAGANVDDAWVGKRVVSNALVPCEKCPSCRRGDTHLCPHRQIFGMHRAGAFADFVSVPMQALLTWPKNLPAHAACLAEPLANGVHVVNLTRHLSAGKVLIIGAGPIGLMCQQAFQALRKSQTIVCDLSEGRLEIARRVGAAHTVHTKGEDAVAACLKWTDNEGVDLVIDAAGSAMTKRLSLEALRPGGAAVWLGLHQDHMELDTYKITLPEKFVFGTYSARKDELREALELIEQGRVDVTSWTESVPLENSVEVFHRMLRPAETDIKAIFVTNSFSL